MINGPPTRGGGPWMPRGPSAMAPDFNEWRHGRTQLTTPRLQVNARHLELPGAARRGLLNIRSFYMGQSHSSTKIPGMSG